MKIKNFLNSMPWLIIAFLISGGCTFDKSVYDDEPAYDNQSLVPNDNQKEIHKTEEAEILVKNNSNMVIEIMIDDQKKLVLNKNEEDSFILPPGNYLISADVYPELRNTLISTPASKFFTVKSGTRRFLITQSGDSNNIFTHIIDFGSMPYFMIF